MKEISDADKEKWLKFLDPENLKDNLLFSSLFIAYFESFKEYVIEEVKYFFVTGFSGDELIISDEYKAKVLSRDKSIIKASLMFLHELGTIDEDTFDLYDELRQYRNQLAHNLMSLLFEGLPENLPAKLAQLIELRVKIERWWILNVDVPTSGEFRADEYPDESLIMSGSQVLNQLIFDMLSGDVKTANYYKEEFEKRFK